MTVNPLLAEFECYQLQQLEPGRYLFAFSGPLDQQREELFRRALQTVLGPEADIAVEQSERLAEPSGKVRTVVDRSKRAAAASDT